MVKKVVIQAAKLHNNNKPKNRFKWHTKSRNPTS